MNENGFVKVSKFSEFAGAVNYSESGGDYCADSCGMKWLDILRKIPGRCYAMRLETYRPDVKAAGKRRRKLGPVQITNKANHFAQRVRGFWFRFSSNGALPDRSQAAEHPGFDSAFRRLIKTMSESSSSVHLPVETPAKRRFYQELCDAAAPGFVRVRESIHNERALFRRDPGSCRSFIVGKDGDGCGIAARTDQARALAVRVRDRGESCAVCPAIKPRKFKGRRGKCGICKACAVVDVVLYPLT